MRRDVLLPFPFLAAAALAAGCASSTAAPAAGGGSGATRAPAPAARPRAALVTELPGFSQAVLGGTRTRTGEPGPRYWTQYARYRLEAEIVPVAKRLVGSGTVTYENRSPVELPEVYFHLYGNLFTREAKRNTSTPMLGGVELQQVMAQGAELQPVTKPNVAGYAVDGTILRIRLPAPLAPGASAEFRFQWRLRVQPDGAPRGGQDNEAWFLSYWYPQVAVFDDVNGWQVDPYLGNGEFYMGHADYDVAITVPHGWLVQATGTLQNPGEVLSARTRERLARARTADSVTSVVGPAEMGPGAATAESPDGKLTWRYRATNVRDVVFGASARWRWDATVAVVGDADGDGRPDTTDVHTFWRPGKERSWWQRSAPYTRHAVEFYSRLLWPYPWPHMTAMDGPTSCGGMEYPMMTCIGGGYDSTSLYEVITHEVGHMWFPMQVGSDEKRFAWMDEGLTQYHQSQAMAAQFRGFDDEGRNRGYYEEFLRRGGKETEMMRHADRFPDDLVYGVASYWKPATVLVALREVLGRDTFERAMREYGRRWRDRHPTPWDFFHTFEDVAQQDLSWFWREWFFETDRLDQAIDTVMRAGDSVDVVVSSRGKAIMPIHLDVTREDGSTDRTVRGVEKWLRGQRRDTLRVAASPIPRRFELDRPNAFPDVDRTNNLWPR